MNDAVEPVAAAAWVSTGVSYPSSDSSPMTRVREDTMHSGTRKGSLVALTSTGGVITSAGLVLAATLLVLGTIPVVFGHSPESPSPWASSSTR